MNLERWVDWVTACGGSRSIDESLEGRGRVRRRQSLIMIALSSQSELASDQFYFVARVSVPARLHVYIST